MAWIEQSSVFVAKYFTKTKPPTLYIFLTKGSVSLPFLGDTSSRLGDEKKTAENNNSTLSETPHHPSVALAANELAGAFRLS